jgi:N-6 DNA Methylase
MINRQALLADLQKFLQRIEADLLERSESTEVPEVPAALHAEYEKATKAERTAQNYEDWRTDTITQAAAAWVLSCVFVRFLEDNSLIDPPKIAGPGERLARARDEHELYFRSHPQHTDREYLLSIFAELAKLPGTKDIFGEHNAINDLPNWLSGDAAGELLNFFQKIDASTGELVHDFTDPNWDTRFLGDLYQDLSEAARKKFALLQTPDFVEEFILDRTLEPALDEFGLEQDLGSSNHGKLPGFDDRNTLRIPFKMIDPACGSGHFLLGAFPRLLDRWQRKEPGTNIRELTQRALNSIHGVDINPFAVAIAKFRLLLVAMKSCDIQRLADAPAFHIHVACGDSLLHGENRTSSGQKLWDYADGATDDELYSHSYPGENLQTVRALLKPGTYHCVVANPPYIVPKDRKLNDWYRKRFSACHMKYSLAVPFMQQIFQLAIPGGYTGQITANSFMKREFGKKLIESFFPTVDLTHVIDTSGAFIPGHGTPTTILFGRSREPVVKTLRTVLGIRGEPSTPEDPARGLVWMSITELIERVGEQNEFVSACDSERVLFCKHPWSIGGGGASELKELLEEKNAATLSVQSDSIGFYAITGEDEVFVVPRAVCLRNSLQSRPFVIGDQVRDWLFEKGEYAVVPYDYRTQEIRAIPPAECPALMKFLWETKAVVRSRSMFGKTVEQHGFFWYEYMQFIRERARSQYLIGFAEVATHNHFVLDRGGKIFKQTAPVIKLSSDATEDDYLALLGILNSSTTCFWMKQVAHQKQMMGGDGIRIESKAKVPYAFSGTQLGKMPIPEAWINGTLREKLLELTRLLELNAFTFAGLTPDREILTGDLSASQMRATWEKLKERHTLIRARMIHLQEEIDFTVYVMWGLGDESLLSERQWIDVRITAGDRPFDILRGRNEDGFPVPNGIPNDWPTGMQQLWRNRINAIKGSSELQLIEDPHYKRRWIGRQGLFNHTKNKDELDLSCEQWFLLRLETYLDFDGRMTDEGETRSKPAVNEVPLGDISIYSVTQLADAARRDPQFMEVGELYRNDPAFDVQALVEELVLAESVPHLPILRYKDSGLRKRAEWEKTWELQRREDAGEAVGTIPVPPKFISADFISTGGARYWSLRGKLDVHKERWISFPHCEGPDGTLVICWAGYDHLQQAQAISAYYVRVQTEFGGSDDPRLIPLLASLIELLPWLKQWHNEPNANFDGLRMGDYFDGFVNEEARALGKTLEEIRAWTPPKGQRGRVAKGQSGRKKGQSRKGSKGQSEEGAAEA